MSTNASSCPTPGIAALELANGTRIALLCSGHGACVDGACLCEAGYRGDACARLSDPPITFAGRLAAYLIAGLGLAACVGLALWAVAMRDHQVLRRATLVFLLLTSLGCAVMLALVFPIGAESNPWDLEPAYLSRSCNGQICAQTWIERCRGCTRSAAAADASCVDGRLAGLSCLGCSLLYSTMVSRVWRLLVLVEGSERGEKVPDDD